MVYKNDSQLYKTRNNKKIIPSLNYYTKIVYTNHIYSAYVSEQVHVQLSSIEVIKAVSFETMIWLWTK